MHSCPNTDIDMVTSRMKRILSMLTEQLSMTLKYQETVEEKETRPR